MVFAKNGSYLLLILHRSFEMCNENIPVIYLPEHDFYRSKISLYDRIIDAKGIPFNTKKTAPLLY